MINAFEGKDVQISGYEVHFEFGWTAACASAPCLSAIHLGSTHDQSLPAAVPTVHMNLRPSHHTI